MSSLPQQLVVEPAEEAVPSVVGRLFRAHDAHPVALMMALMDRFETEWFVWEPETLKTEIVRSMGIKAVSESNWNKIQAVRTLTSADSFWFEWGVFEKIIQAFNNNIPRFDIVQICTIPQLMAGIDIANTIRAMPFDDEVARYIVSCALDYGVTYLPIPLEFAQTILSAPQYRCRDCGNEDYDDLDDGRCDFCCGRFSDRHPLNGKPSPHVSSEVGKNIERYLLRDPEPVRKKFEELRALEDPSTRIQDGVSEDVQALKLLVGHRYMLERKAQLVEQLKMLGNT